MITINLVPEHLRKKTARGVLSSMGMDIPRKVLLGVGGLFVAVLVLSHAVLFAAQAGQTMRLVSLKARWEKLLPDRSRLDAIGGELKDMRKEITTITDITSVRAGRWSRKLNILSDALPKGVWFKRIALDNKSLTLEGGAFSRTGNEIIIVGDLVANLKKDPAFADDLLSIELQNVQRGKRGPTEVAEFTVTAKLK